MKFFLIITIFVASVLFCRGLQVKTYFLDAKSDAKIFFIKGMCGCENLLLLDDSNAFYVTDLSGYVYLIDGDSFENLKINRKLKLSDYALGIDIGNDGYLYIGASGKDWLKKGGPVYRIDKKLEYCEKITGDFPGINGLAIDKDDNIYISTGNFNFWNPEGSIYKISDNNYVPVLFIPKLKSANGMFYDKKNNSIIFSEVYKDVRKIDLGTNKIVNVFGKTRVVEGFDDLCIDKKGNYWVADQPDGFIKRYDPESRIVCRFIFKDAGVASSCRIRVHNGREYIYVTEIKSGKKSKTYDGRGVFIIPLDHLKKFF